MRALNQILVVLNRSDRALNVLEKTLVVIPHV